LIGFQVDNARKPEKGRGHCAAQAWKRSLSEREKEQISWMIPNDALAGKPGTFFGTSFGTARFFSSPNVEAALFFFGLRTRSWYAW
jgi:hypothetical protein